MEKIGKVSIALQPSVYNTFRALNNTVALTLSEYVDNSVQSYINNKSALQTLHNGDYKLKVSIKISSAEDCITISDNAAGIDSTNYVRAFEPANIPIDATGLNEFGMGMKTASVWLANRWSVRTKALNETVERFTEFDLKKVIKENKEELIVSETSSSPSEHYTEIVLTGLSKNAPTSNQMDKIRRHLSSIYRKFIRTGEVEIIINGEQLSSPEYEILNAPYYKTPEGEDIYWKKEVDFELGSYKAKGFIAILKTIQNNANGLVLLRRGRVIQGGGDERYFPHSIFGSSGNFRYKRFFGELELEGFEVTFNKNGFQDEEDLSAFIDALKDELKAPEFNLFGQADNFRQKSKEENKAIVKKIVKTHKKDSDPQQLTQQLVAMEAQVQSIVNNEVKEDPIVEAEAIDSTDDFFELDGKSYKFSVEFVDSSDVNSLYSVELKTEKTELVPIECIVCKINLSHPYFNRFDQFKKSDNYQPVVTIFRSLALAEFLAYKKNIKEPSDLRLFFNRYITQ